MNPGYATVNGLPFRRRAHSAGVTLLEILVATGIGSLLVLACASLLGAAGTIHAETESGVETDRDARAALNILESDLTGRLPLPLYHEQTDSGSTIGLGFWTALPPAAQPATDGISDLCFVYYHIATTGTPEDGGSRELLRTVYSGAAARAHFRSGSPTPPPPAPDTTDVAAGSVFDFRCEFRTRDTTGSWMECDASEAGSGPSECLVTLRLLARDGTSAARPAADSSGGAPPSGPGPDPDENDDTGVRTFRARFFLPMPPP